MAAALSNPFANDTATYREKGTVASSEPYPTPMPTRQPTPTIVSKPNSDASFHPHGNANTSRSEPTATDAPYPQSEHNHDNRPSLSQQACQLIDRVFAPFDAWFVSHPCLFYAVILAMHLGPYIYSAFCWYVYGPADCHEWGVCRHDEGHTLRQSRLCGCCWPT